MLPLKQSLWPEFIKMCRLSNSLDDKKPFLLPSLLSVWVFSFF